MNINKFLYYWKNGHKVRYFESKDIEDVEATKNDAFMLTLIIGVLLTFISFFIIIKCWACFLYTFIVFLVLLFLCFLYRFIFTLLIMKKKEKDE